MVRRKKFNDLIYCCVCCDVVFRKKVTYGVRCYVRKMQRGFMKQENKIIISWMDAAPGIYTLRDKSQVERQND